MSTAGPAQDSATRLPGAEFAARDERLRDDMGRRGLRMLVATSPADIYWLTGFDSFSSYQLQAAVVHPGTVRPILWVHEIPPDARFAAIFGHDVEITATGARSLTSVPLEVVRVS